MSSARHWLARCSPYLTKLNRVCLINMICGNPLRTRLNILVLLLMLLDSLSLSILLSRVSFFHLDFITTMLPELPGLPQKAWIGLKFKLRDTQWVDNSPVAYLNFNPLLHGQLRPIFINASVHLLWKFESYIIDHKELVIWPKHLRNIQKIFCAAFVACYKLYRE